MTSCISLGHSTYLNSKSYKLLHYQILLMHPTFSFTGRQLRAMELVQEALETSQGLATTT